MDQAVIASANAANTLLGLVLLDRHAAGLLVLATGVGYFALHVNRAFVGDVLIALAPRYDRVRHTELARHGLAAALTVGLAAGVLCVATWLVCWLAWPQGAGPDLRHLIWLAPFLPAILLHDTVRCGYLAARQPEKALVVDVLWVMSQGAAATSLIVVDAVSAGGLLASWGIGAAAAAGVCLARTRVRPWQGSPRRWLRETRQLSGWFTATALVGQLHLQAVTFVVAFRLSVVEVSGLRFVQTIVLQPTQNLISAAQGLLVPSNSRTAHAAEQHGVAGQAAVARLRRRTVRLAGGFACLGALFVAVAWPLAELVFSRFGKFADVAPLALPVSLQAAIYLVQLPFTAALRGMHRARSLFLQYVIFSAAGLAGLVAGASANHLTGAAWGLAMGSGVGLLAMIGFTARGLRRLAARWDGPIAGPARSHPKGRPISGAGAPAVSVGAVAAAPEHGAGHSAPVGSSAA